MSPFCRTTCSPPCWAFRTGYAELEKRAGADGVAFAMHPTSLEELMDIADAGLVMPPKSTWFEPKLLSGLFIHELS